MKRRIARLIVIVCLAVGIAFPQAALRAQTNDTTETNLATEDKVNCIHNLKVIYDAIQAYQADHKDLPNWLSDLVPQYLPDPNVLICPACKHSGESESGPLADPKISSSYLFEFCPVAIPQKDLPGSIPRNRRDWKRRQMGVVGSVIPLVRCPHHGVTLNLAFDGRIYESGAMWQDLLTNRVNSGDLTTTRIYADDAKYAPKSAAKEPKSNLTFPPRPADAKPGMVDLTPYYNAMLTESWHGNTNNDLAELPTGLQNFAGTDFDVRGIVQLGSKSDSAKRYPAQIKGIKVHAKCERVEFLHAVAFGNVTTENARVGSYVIHFAGGQSQFEVPIIYGKDARDWHTMANEPPGGENLTVAWSGMNKLSRLRNTKIRLYKMTWTNVAPDLEIESIDFISSMKLPAPFVVAITTE